MINWIRRAVKAIRSVAPTCRLDGLFLSSTLRTSFWWVVEKARIDIAVQLSEQVFDGASIGVDHGLGLVSSVGRTVDPNLRADRTCRRAADATRQARRAELRPLESQCARAPRSCRGHRDTCLTLFPSKSKPNAPSDTPPNQPRGPRLAATRVVASLSVCAVAQGASYELHLVHRRGT